MRLSQPSGAAAMMARNSESRNGSLDLLAATSAEEGPHERQIPLSKSYRYFLTPGGVGCIAFLPFSQIAGQTYLPCPFPALKSIQHPEYIVHLPAQVEVVDGFMPDDSLPTYQEEPVTRPTHAIGTPEALAIPLVRSATIGRGMRRRQGQGVNLSSRDYSRSGARKS